MCSVSYETEMVTVGTKMEIRFLPINYWMSRVVLPLMPVIIWVLCFIIYGAGNIHGDKWLRILAVLPIALLGSAPAFRTLLSDKRIWLNWILKKEKYELLRIQEGRPYLQVLNRREGGEMCIRYFRIRDLREDAAIPWAFDVYKMTLCNVDKKNNSDCS